MGCKDICKKLVNEIIPQRNTVPLKDRNKKYLGKCKMCDIMVKDFRKYKSKAKSGIIRYRCPCCKLPLQCQNFKIARPLKKKLASRISVKKTNITPNEKGHASTLGVIFSQKSFRMS